MNFLRTKHHYRKIGSRIRIHFGTRIRNHYFQIWILGSGSGSTTPERWIRGFESGSTIPKCGYPDPRQYEMIRNTGLQIHNT